MEGDRRKTRQDFPSEYSSAEENARFRNTLNEMRTAGIFTDVFLGCENIRLPAHKLILAAQSKFFRDSLSLEDVNSATILAIQDVSPKIMDILLCFIYKGEMDLRDVSPDILPLLVLAGLKMRIRGIRNYFICKTLECLSKSTFRQALEISEILRSKEMESVVVAYIADSLNDLWFSAELLSLDIEKMSVVVACAYNQETSQDVVLRAILSWVKHDRENRELYLPRLISHVRLQDVKPAYIKFLLEEDPLMRDHPELVWKIHFTEDFKPVNKTTLVEEDRELGATKCSSAATITMPTSKSGTYFLPVIPAISSSTDGSQEMSTKPTSTDGSQEMSTKSSLSQKGYVTSCLRKTVIETENNEMVMKPPPPVIILVGRNHFDELCILYYSIQGDSWTDAESLQLPVIPSQGLLYANNRVFAIGGDDWPHQMSKLPTCYMRNLDMGQTWRLPDICVARSYPQLFMSSGALYVVAGAGKYSTDGLQDVEVLGSEESAIWKNTAPLRDKRDSTASVCIHDGKVYVAGGGSSRVEYYSPATKMWYDVAPLPINYNEFCCFLAVASDRLWVFRGYKPSRMLMLDEAKNAWKVQHTKGLYPEQVTMAEGWKNKIFVTNRCTALHVYDIIARTWYYVNKLPKCLSKVECMAIEDETHNEEHTL